MSRKQRSRASPERLTPYGSESSGSRRVLVLLIILYVGWFVFLTVLALRDSLRP